MSSLIVGLMSVVIFGYSFGQIVIGAIVFMALIAILMLAARVFKFNVPEWFWQVGGIVIAAAILIIAAKFIIGL